MHAGLEDQIATAWGILKQANTELKAEVDRLTAELARAQAAAATVAEPAPLTLGSRRKAE